MIGNSRQRLTGALCAVILSLVAAPSAGAAIDPVSVYTPPASVPPGLGFNGPCGLAVDVVGNLYVSDYYHHTVDVFGNTLEYKTQVKGVDPLDGPCGLAVDSTGKLYVNGYHRNVVRYTPSVFPPAGATTTYGSPLTIDSSHPTGVAVGVSDIVYVNGRDRILAYTTTGAQLGEIGLGDLGEGYGLAADAARLYTADAATNTVKAYNTTTGVLAMTITGPPGGFGSLRDSALAVDRVSGDIYVADRRSSPFSERPESTIQIFGATGAYKGHLKYNVIDAAPVGLAVDNSAGANQGRVYVTSGNTAGAVIYIYTSGAGTTAPPLPPVGSSTQSTDTGAAVVERAAEAAMEENLPAPAAVLASPRVTKRTAKPKRRAKRQRSARSHRHHAKRRSR